jgi:hypothetical protein
MLLIHYAVAWALASPARDIRASRAAPPSAGPPRASPAAEAEGPPRA